METISEKPDKERMLDAAVKQIHDHFGKGWKPIETAPKDGTKLLLFSTRPRCRHPLIVGAWFERWQGWQSVPGNWPAIPTHWLELPEPPEGA